MEHEILAVDEAEEIKMAFDKLTPHANWDVPLGCKLIPWVVMHAVRTGALGGDSRG